MARWVRNALSFGWLVRLMLPIAPAVDARFGDDRDVAIRSADEDEVVLDVHGEELRGAPEEIFMRLARDAFD